jgi:phage I-like protein
MSELMIFRAGKYPQGDWPKERIQKMVDAYDPEKNAEAPVVIGHQRWSDAIEAQYAHGWVKSLRMDGSGKVYAEIPEFSAEVKHAIAEKKLRYMSAEIFEYDKRDAADPPYLRAVALLGRDTPAIPSARIPSMFSAHGEMVSTVDEKELIAAFTRKVSADEIKSLTFEQAASTQEVDMDELEKLKAEFSAQQQQLSALKSENSALRNAEQKKESEAFFSKLRNEGKLTPAVFERAAALDAKLSDNDRQELRAMFSELETKVDLSGEHCASKGKAPSAGSTTLSARIRAFQKEKGIATFEKAASALHATSPELFNEGGAA